MKNLAKIFLLLIAFQILTACDRQDRTKFRFNDTVTVTDGFYYGCIGKVENYEPNSWPSHNKYTLNPITCPDYKGVGSLKHEPENELQLARDGEIKTLEAVIFFTKEEEKEKQNEKTQQKNKNKTK